MSEAVYPVEWLLITTANHRKIRGDNHKHNARVIVNQKWFEWYHQQEINAMLKVRGLGIREATSISDLPDSDLFEQKTQLWNTYRVSAPGVAYHANPGDHWQLLCMNGRTIRQCKIDKRYNYLELDPVVMSLPDEELSALIHWHLYIWSQMLQDHKLPDPALWYRPHTWLLGNVRYQHVVSYADNQLVIEGKVDAFYSLCVRYMTFLTRVLNQHIPYYRTDDGARDRPFYNLDWDELTDYVQHRLARLRRRTDLRRLYHNPCLNNIKVG